MYKLKVEVTNDSIDPFQWIKGIHNRKSRYFTLVIIMNDRVPTAFIIYLECFS